MATSIREMRIKARKLGATNVREMDEDELEEYIAEHSGKNGKSTRKAKRGRPAKKATARKARRVVDEDDDEDEDYEETPRKRGRPKGSKNKATATKRGPGRPKGSGKKASTSTARTSSKRTGKVGRPKGSGTGTRVTLKDKINWNRNFDFREGSTSQYILNQIRKSAKRYEDTDDIREDVIEKLEGKIGKIDELTFTNRSTGRAHKGEAALKMFRYRVSRTMLDYAMETGQHDGGSSTGGSSRSSSTSKRGPGRPPKSAGAKRGPGRPRKVREDDEDEDEAPKRRGRPKGSRNKATAKKRGPGRPKGSGNKVRRGPGRPKGSKNKVSR